MRQPPVVPRPCTRPESRTYLKAELYVSKALVADQRLNVLVQGHGSDNNRRLGARLENESIGPNAFPDNLGVAGRESIACMKFRTVVWSEIVG